VGNTVPCFLKNQILRNRCIGVEADLWGMVQVDTHSLFHVMLLGDSLATAFL